MNNSSHMATFQAVKNRFLLRPSAQYIIPTESIPDNGILSVRCHGPLLAFFRHLNISSGIYITQISVISLATEKTIFTLRYQWKLPFVCGRNLPPAWASSPTRQVCDMAISKEMLSFVTTENVLIFTHLSSSTAPSQVDSLCFAEVVEKVYQVNRPERTCLTIFMHFACMVVQGKAKGGTVTLILLVNTTTLQIHHYKLNTPLDAICFSPTNILSRIAPDVFVLVLQYQDSQHETQLRAVYLAASSTQNPEVHDIKPHSMKYMALLTKIKYTESSIIVCCQTPLNFLDGYLAALHDLSRSFSTPFFSLVASDISKLNTLSSRLNSPWSMPVALMHLLLFIMLLPFLFLPEHATQITISKHDSEIICLRSHRFLRRPHMDGPFANYQLLFQAGENHFGVVQDTPNNIVLQKFTPTPLSKSAYSQPDSFRALSILCYIVCLITFVIAMFLLFTTVKSAKMDLITEFAITDAASVYLLAIAQDAVLGYSLLRCKLKQYFDKSVEEPEQDTRPEYKESRDEKCLKVLPFSIV